MTQRWTSSLASTACCSPTALAIPNRCATRSKRSVTCSGASPCWGSASATSCSSLRRDTARTSCRSDTAARTITSSSARRDGCSSRPRTTASPSSRQMRVKPHTFRSTTERSKGSTSRTSARALCNSTRRPAPVRTTPGRCSSVGWRRCRCVPRRSDLRSICIIGSGPIVIGQACEFDYAGCQALKVLREDGFRTIVVNSNPATIMTDPGFADRTYLEPLDVEGVLGVLRRERPDALMPTMGGQTALNLATELEEAGYLGELGVELIGAGSDAIKRAEDRELFRAAVQSVGLQVPVSTIVHAVDEVEHVALPAVVRPAFTLGGHGGGFVETAAELRHRVELGLAESPIHQVLVEESVR